MWQSEIQKKNIKKIMKNKIEMTFIKARPGTRKGLTANELGIGLLIMSRALDNKEARPSAWST